MLAGLPPSTILAHHLADVTANSSAVAVAKDSSLKMYHVMSVKQSLSEDLAEHSHQISCRAADWSKMSEPLELHVVDALGQQDVPDYFRQPAIAEDVRVMRGPQAEEWIQAVREGIESFKKLGVNEEMSKDCATSTPLPARLILVTKPNVHGGPAWKKARIVICGNFKEVHPDEFTASKTPSYPSFRMALSVASHMGWPIECWDVSTAFVYARPLGDRDTDLGGNEIFVRPPKILVETEGLSSCCLENQESLVWTSNLLTFSMTGPKKGSSWGLTWVMRWTVRPCQILSFHVGAKRHLRI